MEPKRGDGRPGEMRTALVVAMVLAISACSLPWEVRDPPEAFLDADRPPPLSIYPPLVDSEVAVQVPPFAYCWGPLHDGGVQTCTHAEPRFDQVRVTLPAPGDVAFSWMGLAGWAFTARAVEADEPVSLAEELALRVENELIVTVSEIGAWDVVIEGEGPQGDAAYAFRVTVGGSD